MERILNVIIVLLVTICISCLTAFADQKESLMVASGKDGAATIKAQPFTAIPFSKSGEKSKGAIRNAWANLYTAKFDEKTKGCTFDYGPNGMRNIYCYVNSMFSYKKLVELSGVKPFVKGPHSATSLNLESPDDFGHYNIDFVKWLVDNMIPGAEDEEFKWVIQPIYDQFFKRTARVYYMTWLKFKNDDEFRNKVVEKFKSDLAAGELKSFWYTAYDNALPDVIYDEWLDGDYYYGNVVGASVGFWIRRHVDGTIDEFAKGLDKLIKVHDPNFIVTGSKTGGQAQKVQKPGDRVAVEVQDQALRKFLLDLTAYIEKHDWKMVLTFFAPENYRVQKDMGLDDAQYIEEGLGLGMVDNHLIPRPGDGTKFAMLNSIDRISITGIQPSEEPGMFIIEGIVVLFDNTSRHVSIFVYKTDTGGYIIEPAVG